jgi:hypothetical protein
MHGNMNVFGKTFDGQIYCLERAPLFFIARRGQVCLIELDGLQPASANRIKFLRNSFAASIVIFTGLRA